MLSKQDFCPQEQLIRQLPAYTYLNLPLMSQNIMMWGKRYQSFFVTLDCDTKDLNQKSLTCSQCLIVCCFKKKIHKQVILYISNAHLFFSMTQKCELRFFYLVIMKREMLNHQAVEAACTDQTICHQAGYSLVKDQKYCLLIKHSYY